MEDAAAAQRLMNLQENGERISQTLSTLKQEQDRIHESLRGGESEQKEWTKRLDSVTAAIKGLADQIVVEQEKIGDLQKQRAEKNSRSVSAPAEHFPVSACACSGATSLVFPVSACACAAHRLGLFS